MFRKKDHLPLAKLDVDEEENNAVEDANGSHHDVSDPQEVVFAAKHGGRRQDHSLLARKLIHSKV